MSTIDATPETSETAAPDRLSMFWQHQRRALAETRKALTSLLPSATRKHGQAAIDETVAGYRGLIDAAADKAVDALDNTQWH
ncbi:MAG: hypothetical protein GYB67_15025 [Chloroflexi bacterium]|nr:hypothetical protein [Chloroflexota bacterium]